MVVRFCCKRRRLRYTILPPSLHRIRRDERSEEMKFPDNHATHLTEAIMTKVLAKNPNMPTHQYNGIYSSIFEVLDKEHSAQLNNALRSAEYHRNAEIKAAGERNQLQAQCNPYHYFKVHEIGRPLPIDTEILLDDGRWVEACSWPQYDATKNYQARVKKGDKK